MEIVNNLQVLFERAINTKTSPSETHQLVLKSRDVISQQRKFAIECQNRCKLLEALYVKRDETLMQKKYQAEVEARQLKIQCDRIRIEIMSKQARQDTMMAEQRKFESEMKNYQHKKKRAERRSNNAFWLFFIPVAGPIVASLVKRNADYDVHYFNDRIISLHYEMNNLMGEIQQNRQSLSDLENKIKFKNDQINMTSQKIKNTQNNIKEIRQIVAFCVQACNVWQELDINGKNLELKASTISKILQNYENRSESQSLKFFRSRGFTNQTATFYSDWIDFTKAIQDKSNNSLRFKCEHCDREYNGLPLTKNDMIVCERCYKIIEFLNRLFHKIFS